MFSQCDDGTLVASRTDKAGILEFEAMFYVVLFSKYSLEGYESPTNEKENEVYHVSVKSMYPTADLQVALQHLKTFATQLHVRNWHIHETPIPVRTLKKQWFLLAREQLICLEHS